ncbi:MAG: hypothetical protein JSS24_14295 [Proteobacteria bacterium]|nr:hypothetical protein [Pseudomonadota bacterium]
METLKALTLRLPAALERFVADQVEQGAFRNRKAAIVAAVASEKQRAEQRAWLKEELQKGLASPIAATFDMEKIIRRGRARQTARKRRRSA